MYKREINLFIKWVNKQSSHPDYSDDKLYEQNNLSAKYQSLGDFKTLKAILFFKINVFYYTYKPLSRLR